MDFSKLSVPTASKSPTDPFKIFAGLPRVSGAPNDLWRGQADALEQWDKVRSALDVHVNLNTGAGKTIVGLLIAKSFVNEGLENVLYVCPTIDLVLQTANQAKSIGMEVTLRAGGDFDNDLFESGKTFCITTYAALFNGHSALRRKFFPQAIIFDDAHVAEPTMRDAFSLRFARKDFQQLFDEMAALLLPTFQELGREVEFREACDPGRRIPQSVLVPPHSVIANAAQIAALLRRNGAAEHKSLTFAFEHLKDKIDRCAIIIRGGQCEITPPFIPSLALNIFDQKVRRVYLSATLHNKADIIRAFGRAPNHIIEPNNDAGNGERLIIFQRLLSDKIDEKLVEEVSKKHKIVIAVPSYYAAGNWKALAKPAEPDSFSTQLDAFRKARSGIFLLVSRVDGIDLPHDTCRVMVIDGLPTAAGLLERHQYELLHMRSFFSSRVANRLVQLFGRINRGRSDYGSFLIAGRDLNAWMNNDKNVALLPDLLKSQILLGRHVQEAMEVKDSAALTKLLDTVILSDPRDAGWLEYYSKFIGANDVSAEATERARAIEAQNMKAALAEAQYAKLTWEGDFSGARAALDDSVPATARTDEKLAGWHNLWIGACLEHEGDSEEARFYYVRARGQLGLNLAIPVGQIGPQVAAGTEPVRRPIVQRIFELTTLGAESYNRQYSKLVNSLAPLKGATPSQMEEAARSLGEFLGFESTRPDNDLNIGPDVLWVDSQSKSAIGIELKTDKNTPYNKDDIGQSLNHLNWMAENCGNASIIGVVLVGPHKGVTEQASPSKDLFSVATLALQGLADQLTALIRDARNQTPLHRLDYIESATKQGWALVDLAKQLCGEPLA